MKHTEFHIMSRWLLKLLRVVLILLLVSLLHHHFYRARLYKPLYPDDVDVEPSQHLPDSKFAVVTFGQHDQLERLLNLIGSIQFFSPWVPIIIYVRSLTAHEVLALSCLQNVRVELMAAPSNTLKLVHEALHFHENVLFLDPNVEVRKSLSPIIDIISNTGAFFISTQQTVEEVWPHHHLNISNQILSKLSCNQHVFGFSRNSSAFKQVLHPILQAYDCYENLQCKTLEAPFPALLSRHVYKHGFVVQDTFHYYIEENPLYFDRNFLSFRQPHSFILRNNLDPFEFLPHVQWEVDHCLSAEQAFSKKNGGTLSSSEK